MGNKVSLEEEMINMRIVSKTMQRSAKKCEKNEKAAIEKLKKVRISIIMMFIHINVILVLLLLRITNYSTTVLYILYGWGWIE